MRFYYVTAVIKEGLCISYLSEKISIDPVDWIDQKLKERDEFVKNELHRHSESKYKYFNPLLFWSINLIYSKEITEEQHSNKVVTTL